MNLDGQLVSHPAFGHKHRMKTYKQRRSEIEQWRQPLGAYCSDTKMCQLAIGWCRKLERKNRALLTGSEMKSSGVCSKSYTNRLSLDHLVSGFSCQSLLPD